MPTTYNGCGTRYAGKSNVTERCGQCRSCGRTGNLTSYDTWLCAVVLFVPVFPLGKKRIIDQCGSCGRHYVMKLQEWETKRQLGVSGSLEDYRTGPTVDRAIAAHATMTSFRQMDGADAFRREVEAKFPDNAQLNLYFAETDREDGRVESADAAVGRAFALRPDLPETRIAMAGIHRRAGRLQEARALLDLLEKPGSGRLYPLSELELLGYAWQDAGWHRGTLDMLQHLLKELPVAGQNPAFRERILKSERALKLTDSILPKRDRSLKALMSGKSSRRWVLAGAVAAVIAAGMPVRNEYVRRHRELTVVNGLNAPLSVSVDGGAALNVAPGGRAALTVAEGAHRAKVTGAIAEEIDFTLETGYFERWSNDPVFILNPGGMAPLEFIRATYSAARLPPQYRVHLGERYTAFEDIDYLFKPLPESVRLKDGELKVLTSLNIPVVPPAAVIAAIAREQGAQAAMRSAESVLRAEADNESLLNVYGGVVTTPAERQRAIDYLAAGLARRPVEIRWHRTWQDLHNTPQAKAKAQQHYQNMLDAEPENADLLYLTGRAMGDGTKSLPLYEKACRLAPQNPWPVFAIGYLRMEQGRWQEAREQVQKATGLAPGDERFQDVLFDIRLGCGEAAVLAKELAATNEFDISNRIRHLRAWAATGDRINGDRVHTNLQMTLSAMKVPPEEKTIVQYQWLYMSRQFELLAEFARKEPGPAGRGAEAWLDLHSGRVESAIKNFAAAGMENDLTLLLALWTGALLGQDDARVKECREAAATALESAGGSGARAAGIVRQESPVTTDQLAGLFLDPQDKALLCAALSRSRPAEKGLLAAEAKRFHADRRFPSEVIRRALGE